MLKRVLGLAALALAGGAGILWWMTAPSSGVVPAAGDVTGDADRGAAVFHASGCASCHAAPDSEDSRVLAGGEAIDSDFGTFHAPNISMDADAGVGDWTLAQFDAALRRGVSPEGRHYYPAFPYTSYARMTDGDVADLWAYMRTLPADATPNVPHDLDFPYSIRRGVGLWKRLYLDDGFVTDVAPELERGRYLVEALGHCAECHTPRDGLGGLDASAWMAGAPNPSGSGRIPALTPDALTWSEADIAYYLETGFTPSYDSVGGSMRSVVTNFAKLPAGDREAVAAYLKALPDR